MSEIQIELSQIGIEKRLIDGAFRHINSGKEFIGVTPTLIELNADTTVRNIENLQSMKQRLNELSQEFTPKHPDVRALREIYLWLRVG